MIKQGLGKNINTDLTFGIVMPTFRLKRNAEIHTSRAIYVETIDLLRESIGSIKSQTYNNWKLFLIGDAYEDDHEVKDLLNSMLNRDQYEYYNLPTPGERTQDITKFEKRITGGIAAMNKGVDMAYDANVDIIARLDHDDKWTPEHLELLARAYTQIPDLAFAFTQSRKRIGGNNRGKNRNTAEYMFMPDLKIGFGINNKGYVTDATGHSSITWSPKQLGKIHYRDAFKQKSTEPKRSRTQAGDTDMFKRVMDKLKKEDLKYVYIPKMTNYVRNRQGKL